MRDLCLNSLCWGGVYSERSWFRLKMGCPTAPNLYASAWPPPCHGGWPSPARPSRMKCQPRTRFEALAVRGGRIFRSKWGFGSWTPRRPLEAPEGPWRPLEAPGGPWAPEPPWRVETPHAWMKRSNLYRPLFILWLTIYTMMGLAFWVHLIGICGGL